MAAGLRVILQRQYMQKRLLALYLPMAAGGHRPGADPAHLAALRQILWRQLRLVGLVVAGQGIGTLLADLPTSLLLHRFLIQNRGDDGSRCHRPCARFALPRADHPHRTRAMYPGGRGSRAVLHLAIGLRHRDGRAATAWQGNCRFWRDDAHRCLHRPGNWRLRSAPTWVCAASFC